MAWIVIRRKFNEKELQFLFDGLFEIESDEKLLKFIREIIANSGEKYLWQITKTKAK